MSELGDSMRYFWTLTRIPGYDTKTGLLMTNRTHKDKELGTQEQYSDE